MTSDEILAQMFFAKKICRLYHLPDVRNVVFMGKKHQFHYCFPLFRKLKNLSLTLCIKIVVLFFRSISCTTNISFHSNRNLPTLGMGEPADNAEAVVQAARILTTRELFQLSASKVTVSTVAPTPESFAKFVTAPVVLAWSVHAARDDLRKQLVPTTKYSMHELRQGMIDALCQRPKHLRTTMLEVALMADVNDSLREAQEMADFARGIVDAVPDCKLIVNLIPYNPTGHSQFRTPTADRVEAFQKHLWSEGVFAHVRSTRGDEKDAACGQLATKKKARPQPKQSP